MFTDDQNPPLYVDGFRVEDTLDDSREGGGESKVDEDGDNDEDGEKDKIEEKDQDQDKDKDDAKNEQKHEGEPKDLT